MATAMKNNEKRHRERTPQGWSYVGKSIARHGQRCRGYKGRGGVSIKEIRVFLWHLLRKLNGRSKAKETYLPRSGEVIPALLCND